MSVAKRSKASQSVQANDSRKRPVSERRIDANRRNALLSTGPVTERGKRTVARNAIKHGFLAREVVITAGDGKENLSEFHDLVERLCEHYKPVDVVEESLVQTIATCWWRKARVIRAENGEIRKRLDLLAVDRVLQLSDETNLNVAIEASDLCLFPTTKSDEKVYSKERWATLQDVEINLRRHRSGLDYMRSLLMDAKLGVTSAGHIPDRLQEKIYSAFYFWDPVFALSCQASVAPYPKVEPSASPDIGTQESDRRAALVALIDGRLEKIDHFKGLAEEREEFALDAEPRRCSLPPADATDKLIRYETHLDRQLYRAMDQLDRLQRQRRGERVPPPLNISFERRG